MKFTLRVLFSATSLLLHKHALAALSQGQESHYLVNFEAMQAASYSVLQDEDKLPSNLISQCKNSGDTPIREVTVQPQANGYVSSSQVSQQCGTDSVCTIPLGTTFQFDQSINLGALVVHGAVQWNDGTQLDPSAFLCAGYVAIEGHGKWEMDLQYKDAVIYIKDNGAVHSRLRSRAFGSYAASPGDYPVVDINGRELVRTWSLLADPLKEGEDEMKLMHDPNLMGWRVGDRIAVSPTEVRATGHGEEFTITDISDNGTLQLSKSAEYNHDASFVPGTRSPALLSSEVVNLSRNIVITGDDFKHLTCNPNLPEAVPGEQTSTDGCRCSSFRNTCTMGLHTSIMNSGEARISNIRVEKCGQRGVEGKYCMHFHKLHDCPTCVFKNNAIENSHQRGIIVHSTHSSRVEQNVLYNVRGAGIYIEDGNEMYNDIKYNVVICPFPFRDGNLHGCTIPGTSNRIADTSDNQSGIFSRAATNDLTGNRVSNSFNGMLLDAGSIGRGDSYGKVCEADAILGRIEGNTFHGNGRFGTYTLGGNYAKPTDQSILTDGHNIDKSLCNGFDSQGYARGQAGSIVDNLDYGNAFVGHYEAGEIQYVGHQSFNNNELIYWKETKNFDNGCSAHITGGSYARGNVALPDQSTFIIESTSFGDSVSIEANHHCNVGTTGVLCFPQYIFHDIIWKNTDTSKKWIWFQDGNTQSHNANQNHGGVFSLSPPNVEAVKNGTLRNSIFPPGYVSLVSNKFTYLLSLPGNVCIRSSDISSLYGMLYSDGILCKEPLRSLKIYTRGLLSGNAPSLRVEMWYNRGGIESQTTSPNASQLVRFHQVGNDYASPKQGFAFPVIPGLDHNYRVSLNTGSGDIPYDWVVEFSDQVMSNRFGFIEYTNLSLNGSPCGINGLISSLHDRRFIWSGDAFMPDESAWGNTGACALGMLPDMQQVDCGEMNNGVLMAQACPDLCDNECNEASSFCDCGSATCKCKPGFQGDDCSDDLCSAARCGDHGKCAAKYLGGVLPVTSNACVCDEGWSGPLCQFNPCLTLGKTCSGHGTCVATSDTEAECVCDAGFSGEDCSENCHGVCVGSFPFGCATDINNVVQYGCHPGGGCNYLKQDEEYPYSGFCTYKMVTKDQDCVCGDDNECEMSRSCNVDGSCPVGQFLPDDTPCNSVPYGTCQSGKCTQVSNTSPTTSLPTLTPSISIHAPISISPTPTAKPSNSPVIYTSEPTNPLTPGHCGCSSCTDYVWNTPASDDGGDYTCGARITWLQTPAGGGMSEIDACMKVAGIEFREGPCGPLCDPSRCISTPTLAPSISTKAPISTPPSNTPTNAPSSTPSKSPLQSPTTNPSSSPLTSMPTSHSSQSHCGCAKCTDDVWNTPASDGGGDYTCGARITWLQTPAGGGMSEIDACMKVAGIEFKEGPCGPFCDPMKCGSDSIFA